MSYLKALLKITFIVSLLLLGGITFYTYAYGDEIKAYLLKEINKQLLVQTDVEDVEISLLQNFPNLSLILKDVNMKSEDKTIITAEDMRVKFSLADLIDKNFILHSVSISNGALNLLEDKNGRYFPKIWEEKKDKEQTSDFSFELNLQKVGLKNIGLQIKDQKESTAFDLTVKYAWAKGNFGSDLYELAWNSEIEKFSYSKNGKSIIKDQDLKLEAICQIRNESQSILLNQVDLVWENIPISAKGKINYKENVVVELDFDKGKAPLSEYSNLMPEKTRQRLDSLNAKANLALKGRLEGELSPIFRPSLLINFEINKASLSSPSNYWQANELRLQGKYENANISKENIAFISVDTVEGKLNQLDFHGNAYWSQSPSSNLNFEGVINGELVKLNEFMADSSQFNGGDFELNLDLKLPMDLLGKSNSKAWKKGENSLYLKISEGSLDVNSKYQIRHLNTEAALGKNDLYAEHLSFDVNEISANFKGQFLNLVSFIEDSNAVLFVDGNLNSKSIKIEELINLTASDNEGSNNLQFYFNCKVDEMTYKDLVMEEVSCNLRMKDDLLLFSNYSFLTLGGDISGDLSLQLRKDRTILQTESEFNNIDVNGMFKAFYDFDQDMIKGENIYGIASGLMNMELSYDEKGEIMSETLILNGFIDIQEGRLVKYKPIYELSKYIKLDELKEIRFSRLQNQVRIENRTIHIPRFNINSSAINLQMEGTHSFDNEVDYRFSLLLDQILGKKAKKSKESEFGYIEDDGLGKTQLFLKMTGNIDDPKVAYDNQQLKAHLKNEVQEEKRELKAIFKEEFGLFKKDTTLKSPTESKSQSAPFQIEWDEDPVENPKNEVKTSTPKEKKSKKKGKFGKFIDKIAKPNEDEYVPPQD